MVKDLRPATLSTKRVLREAVKRGDGHEERGELRMIDEFKVERLLLGRGSAGNQQRQIQGNHWRRRAQLAGDDGEVIAGNRADGAADIDDLRGSEFGRERREDAGASHGKLNVAEIHKRMPAEVDAISLDRGDGACGIDGGVALHEHHTGHFAGHEMRIVRTRRGGAALRGDEAITLNLSGELLERGRLETRKDERRLDGFECRAGWQACTRGSFTGKGELFRGRLRESL